MDCHKFPELKRISIEERSVIRDIEQLENHLFKVRITAISLSSSTSLNVAMLGKRALHLVSDYQNTLSKLRELHSEILSTAEKEIKETYREVYY